MFKLSPLLKFVLYLGFVSFCVIYLTKDRLDEKSRYMLIGLLVVPYIFTDQINNYTDVSSSLANFKINKVMPINKNIIEAAPITPPINSQQPKIENYEDVKNINIENELKEKNSEKVDENKLTDNNKKVIENFSNNDISKIITLLQNVQQAQTSSPTTPIDLSTLKITNTPGLQPLGANGDGLTNEWDQDYVLLNTHKWGPSLNPPPVCVTDKKCPVCPSLTSGYPLSLKDFDSSRKVTTGVKANTPAMNA
jgi:hypothetical protein